MVNLDFFSRNSKRSLSWGVRFKSNEGRSKKKLGGEKQLWSGFRVTAYCQILLRFCVFREPGDLQLLLRDKTVSTGRLPSLTYLWASTLQKWEKFVTSTRRFRIMLDFIHSGNFYEPSKKYSGGHAKQTCAHPYTRQIAQESSAQPYEVSQQWHTHLYAPSCQILFKIRQI